VLGEDAAKQLSPWGILKEKTIESFGRPHQVYIPVGVSILDYYDLYKKFTYSQLESYTLDHVAWHEVKKRKVNYKDEYGTLQNLYEKNYPLYVEYNVGDLDRVWEIEEKNKFLELAVTIAYDAKINYIDSLTSVLLWETIIHNHLLAQNRALPTDMRSESKLVPGGYVKEPRLGLSEWVVSFDLQSLYPHLIMQYNISPETLVYIDPWDDKQRELVIKEEYKAGGLYSVAGNGARFRNDFQGFLPELMKIQFEKRLEYKTKMLELKKTDPKNKNDIAKYHNFQLAKKISLNSAYGALANEWCRFYDWRLASAITLSGQLSILYIERRINEFLNETFKTNIDYVIAIDTDSVYIDCKPFIDKFMPSETTEKKITFLDKVAKKHIQPFIDKSYAKLAKQMNAFENAMVMKRDIIADKAIWRAKKGYAMRVWDAEGLRYEKPELKIMGLEVVKAVIPQICRDAMKNCLSIIMDGDQKATQNYIEEFKRTFDELPVEEISFPRGCQGLRKYSDKTTIYAKGSPVHVKGALVYNHLIKKANLQELHPLINDKDKLKFVYLKTPNPAFCDVISYPQYLPTELDLHKYVDYDLMFSKTFLEPIKSILSLLGWVHEEQSTLESFFS
jgi:DNA polymerase elongation subunit (family B)